MKTLKQNKLIVCSSVLMFLWFPIAVFANGEEHVSEEHNGISQLNDVAVINPLYAAAFVGGAAVIGFLVWRLLLKK